MKELARWSLAAVGAAIWFLALARLLMANPDLSVKTVLVGSFLVMAVLGFALGHWTQPEWPIVLFGFGGIACGVVANAFYEGLVYHIDHNLFPIEIGAFAALGVPGLGVGVAAAHAVNRRRRRQR